MKDYAQYVYKCTDFRENDKNPYYMIRGTSESAFVQTHSIAFPPSVAWIMYKKYMLYVPLYPQEWNFRRMDAELKRDIMTNEVIRYSEYWLKPLNERMHRKLLKCEIIMSYETTWQVNKK